MADKKIQTLKILTKKQVMEGIDILKYYNRCYLCNICGTLYGTDYLEKNKICPVCENTLLKEKKKKKEMNIIDGLNNEEED